MWQDIKLYYYYYYCYYYYYFVLWLSFSSWYFPSITTTQVSSFRLLYFIVCCVSCIALLFCKSIECFPGRASIFFFKDLLLLRSLKLLTVKFYITYFTFVVSLHMNSSILYSLLLLFAWNSLPLILPYLPVCMFSGFCSYILIICYNSCTCVYPLIPYHCHI